MDKNPRQSETYLEPSRTSNMKPFSDLFECIQTFTNFEKRSILGVSQGIYATGKSKEKLGALLFISQKISTAISADFFGERLLIAN